MENLPEIRIDSGKLKEARGPMPMSEVARQIGISRQRLFAYETGVDRCPADVLARLCLLYRKSVEYFIHAQ